MSKGFHKAFYTLPSFLIEGEGELVHGSLAALMSANTERAEEGLLARFPEYAHPSALAYLGRDRKIVRGIDEPAASYAARLVRWLDDHRVRGNPYALHAQLRAYAQADIMVRTVDRSGNWFTTAADGTLTAAIATGNWDWDATPAAQWSRFWVIMYPTADGKPWAKAAGTFGVGGGVWGGAVGSPGYTIGTTATAEQVSSVRQIVRDWMPDGTRCEWIIIAFDPASFDPTAPEPNGTWKNWGLDTAGNYAPERLSTARYWKGVQGAAPT